MVSMERGAAPLFRPFTHLQTVTRITNTVITLCHCLAKGPS
jgi:hypothetical protein